MRARPSPPWTLATFALSLLGCDRLSKDEPSPQASKPPEAQEAGICRKARNLEQDGKYDKARDAYQTCIQDGGGFVDTHLGYQRILQVEDGSEQARKTYETLKSEVEGPMVTWAAARLQPREDRIRTLQTLSAEHPEFAVAYYDLSRLYSAEEVGVQSLDDKAHEKLYLTEFLKRAQGKDGYKKLFIDYEVATQMLRDAERRLGLLEHVDLSKRKEPVKLIAMPHNAGWSLTFQVAELATTIESKLPGDEDWVEGWSRQIPPAPDKQTVQVRYKGAREQWLGPFELQFDPRSALTGFVKQALQTVGPHAWLAIQSPTGTPNLYFTILYSYRCGIDKVEYGFDTETPNEIKTLPPCNPDDPYAIEDIEGIYEPLPAGTRFVTYRITFADGERSDIHRLDAK